jgi:hypothetical protein
MHDNLHGERGRLVSFETLDTSGPISRTSHYPHVHAVHPLFDAAVLLEASKVPTGSVRSAPGA